jgi:DNA (cytosine-5)-methyltransferase 1
MPRKPAIPDNPRELVAVDLFAGAGGMTLGLKRAGFDVRAAVELEPLAVETYLANHPDVAVFRGDIRLIPPEVVLAWLGLGPGELDLVAGCPPCQGFSTITTLNGKRQVEDERNDLVHTYGHYISVMQPRSVLMENVPRLRDDPRMHSLLATLEGLGYVVNDAVRILNAADFGVPQRRRRLVLLAAQGSKVAFSAPTATAKKTVRDAIGSLAKPGKSGDPLHDLPERRSAEVRSLIRRIPADGGGRLDLDKDEQLVCHQDFDGFKDIYGRMAWDKPSPTITGGCANPSKGRFLHPKEHRAITLREAALLQGFPADYYFSLRRGKFPAAAMIGNALPPAFVEAHASELANHLTSPGRTSAS